MKVLIAFTLVFCVVFMTSALAAPYDDVSKYDEDKELARELASLIYQASRRGEPTLFAAKRNSELVNTLLGLPKVLNDAGRRK